MTEILGLITYSMRSSVQSVKIILTSKKRRGAISAHLALSSAMERGSNESRRTIGRIAGT
jgi:hypothetical protein